MWEVIYKVDTSQNCTENNGQQTSYIKIKWKTREREREYKMTQDGPVAHTGDYILNIRVLYF